MFIVGVDLSGPVNTAATVMQVYTVKAGSLHLHEMLHDIDDNEIYSVIKTLAVKSRMVVGIDAPLSYNIGGGDRPSDAEARQKAFEYGLRSSTIMTPTMARMIYLTARGISLTRLIMSITGADIRQIEVHPALTMALHGASVADLRNLKKSLAARKRLSRWLEKQGLQGMVTDRDYSDHDIAAAGTVLGAWKWQRNCSAWRYAARWPHHPFDFAC